MDRVRSVPSTRPEFLTLSRIGAFSVNCGVPWTTRVGSHPLRPAAVPARRGLRNSAGHAVKAGCHQIRCQKGTTFASALTTAGSCKTPAAGATGIVTWTVPSMGSGSSFTVTLVVNVTAKSGSTFRTSPKSWPRHSIRTPSKI